MVNATVDNNVVSIQLQGTSTTVPSNETWVVQIGVHGGRDQSAFKLNSMGVVQQSTIDSNERSIQYKMVLTGGDTVEEGSGGGNSLVSVQGFVVDS